VKKYNCSVCNTALSKTAYEKALGIVEERDRLLEAERAKVAKENDGLKRQLKQFQKRAAEAHEEGVQTERARNRRLLAGKDSRIQYLEDRLRQVETGATPQTDGLEFEAKLCARLRREFPDDVVQHKGKGGDVLHLVRFEGEPAGSIIYECKRTPGVLTQHLRQTIAAKKERGADFAVLVTTGRKKGFNGFSQMNGVLVVSPLAVVHACNLLRDHLIEMARSNFDRRTRDTIAQRLMAYVKGPEFTNYVERMVRFSADMQETLEDEIKEHLRGWERRQTCYHALGRETAQMQRNLSLVLHGREPKLIEAPKATKLPIRKRLAIGT
jgi:hypothetical protein